MSGHEVYKKWHWGVEPSEVVEIKPPPVVDDTADKEKWNKMKLVECGRLVEIHYAPLNKSSKRKDKIFRLNRNQSNASHLCFDMDHDHQRLYFIMSPSTRDKALKDLSNDYELLPLSELAYEAGGLHAPKVNPKGKAVDDYEDIFVQPIGIMTNVVYACEKKGDGYSFYIHALGEESGIRPVLGMAEDGSLWFAGGNYTAPIQGITD